MGEEFIKQPTLLKKFSTKATAEDKKKTRKILLFVIILSAVFIGTPLIYRQMPVLLEKIKQPQTAVVEKFEKQVSTPTPMVTFNNIKKAAEEILPPLRGKYGIYFLDINSKTGFNINGTDKFTAASLIKLPVLLTLFKESDKKAINLDLVYRLQESDKRGGAGSLGGRPAGYEISYRKMAQLMGQQSDNTAFNIISRILGPAKIQNTIDELGMKNTSFDQGDTTPEDISIFFEKLYADGLLSTESKEELFSYLTNSIWEDRIPAGVPQGIRVVHKIGTEVGVINDAGIIYTEKPFILVIMTDGANEIEAKKALPEIAKKIYEMFINDNTGQEGGER